MAKRKQLTFDLDTNIAKKILGNENYTKAYADIGRVMKSKGWIHIEGSVYMSKKSLSVMEVAQLLDDLKMKYPYLTKCIRNMHQSDISNVHSLNNHFEYDGTPGKFAQKEKVEQKQNKGKRQSVAKLLAEKKAIVEKQKKQVSKNPKSKSHNQEL